MADCNSCAARGGCPSANPEGRCPSSAGEGGAVKRSRDVFEILPPASGAEVRHVLAVASGKGGVGKSAVSAMLAVQLQRIGLRVGILDADVTGPSIPQAFGVQEQMAKAMGERMMLPVRTKTGIQLMSINVLLQDATAPVVWRGPVIASVIRQFWQEVLWEDLDVLVVDMPPGTGDVPLTVYQSLPVDGLVMVATPQELVAMIVKKAKRMAETMQVPLLGLVENMSYFVCPDCAAKHRIFGSSPSAEAAASMGIPLLAELPLDPALAALVDAGEIESLPGLLLAEASLRVWTRLKQLRGLRGEACAEA